MHPARDSAHRQRTRRAWMQALALTAVVAVSGVRGAQADEPDVARARDAYDRGMRAHAAGDHAAAAKAFAEADALAPTAASLEAALEAAMRADDAALGAELLARSETRAQRDASLTASIEAAKKRFQGRTGTIRVDCGAAARCMIAVDGRAADGARPFLTTVGPHHVIVERDEEHFERLVEVTPGAAVVVHGPDAPKYQPTPLVASAGPARRGISPTWFFVGLGATVLSATAATISGLDALGRHDDFVAAGCAHGSSGPKAADCNARSDAGEGVTLRTNLLVGLTALLAVNTAVLGAVFVRWSPAPSGGVAVLEGRLP